MQSELLANSAGLSLQYEAVDLMDALRYQGSVRMLCERSLVSERMFRYYKVKVPSKQALLAMAVALSMREEAVEELLRKYGYCLSASIAGDVVVRWHIRQGIREKKSGKTVLFEINAILERMGLPLLMTRQL